MERLEDNAWKLDVYAVCRLWTLVDIVNTIDVVNVVNTVNIDEEMPPVAHSVHEGISLEQENHQCTRLTITRSS